MKIEESAIKVKMSKLRPMAKEIVGGIIDKGSNSVVFSVLRGAGKKIKVLGGRESPSVQIEDLRKWFGKGKKGDWVRVGTDGEIKGDCAREPGEGKPKCMPRSKAHSMSKKDRASAARRKRAKDPEVDRPGTGNTPIMVKTDKEKKKKMNESTKVPAGMKFLAAYEYKDANGKKHSHRHYSKGGKITSPVVVYIDGKEWKTFQSFTKAKQAAINHIKGMKESVEEKRDASKSATGYDIYHDTYAAAMQHAYAHAKKKFGVTVRPSEVDDKVALGPKKPSTGKTVSHILKTDSKKNLHVQVYNTGRKYELNMYVESVELEEKNVPTNPSLWAKVKAQAKAKFDVYPSAYANGWASKQYKAAGGGWKSVKEELEEKAVSKSQQKFMGMVRAVQKGDMKSPSPEVAKAAKTMSKKDVKDFAATKHKGLPDQKEATMADKAGPGKGKDMRDMSKLDHAKARDWHQYRVKTKGDYHSKMAKIHHANAIGGSSMLHKETVMSFGNFLTEANIDKALKIMGPAQNMPQAVSLLMKHMNLSKPAAERLAKQVMAKLKENVVNEENTIELARDVVKNKGAKKGLDMQTANLILQVYNKVNDANKKKMETMPVSKLGPAVWKMVGKK